MKMQQTECSEMWTYKMKMPGNYPEEIVQHTEHGESLKSVYLDLSHMLYLLQLNQFWMLLSGQKPWMKFSYKTILVIQHYHFSTLVVHWESCEVIQVSNIIYFAE